MPRYRLPHALAGFLLLLTLALSGIASPAMAQALSTTRAAPASSVVTTPHVRAELVALAPDGVSPGAPVQVGLRITHQPHWHTYWKNAGDSGLPTELAWTLPPGLSAGEVAWPVPRKIPIGTLANYGYEGTVLLPVPLTVAPDFAPPAALAGAPSVDIRLKAAWLVCRQECIPEEGEFVLRLPVRGSTALDAGAFDAARAAQPVALAAPGRVEIDGATLRIRLDGLPPEARGRSLELFPETADVIRTAATPQQSWDGERWSATVPLADHRSASPAEMPVVVALAETDRRDGAPIAWRAVAPVAGAWPATATPAAVPPALQAALAANAAAPSAPAPAPVPAGGFVVALLGALLGGLLLNLMPCVFPVLAIKVLGFARHGGDRAGHRRAGLAYTAGVLLSFLALGAAMLALRAAGAQLGWGFQLQSPAVVAALAALFTLIGLNLAGLFEVRVPGVASLGGVRSAHPRVDDFLSGVLAVVVASPCTAPFMGASLGLAIGLPPAQALMLFAALGLGLALPYLVASFVPAVARRLPRPGAWMDTLRRLLSFPMFATVAWLVWVLGQQSGIDGAGALLALLVCLAAVAWAFTLRGRARLGLAGALLAVTALTVATIGGNVVRPAEAPVGTTGVAGARWQPWSAQRVAELHAQGRPVFVDFTAAWCVTCQYNKQTTLADAGLLAEFDARRVALLRADWTRRDPAITAALAALGRSGVPVYVLQAPGRAPVVLTEILGRDEVRAALGAL
ncbi:protein-disulfide reductase DsbD family protein [Variovorax sp. PvP013]|uniref:protein-disulfide reductase DsbD family protein n=1 Tax=Variovorax sp. PvP013 TaxID=3156435 RepID=UPI003D19FBCF